MKLSNIIFATILMLSSNYSNAQNYIEYAGVTTSESKLPPGYEVRVKMGLPKLDVPAALTDSWKSCYTDVDGYPACNCSTYIYFDSGTVELSIAKQNTGETIKNQDKALISVSFTDGTDRGASCYPHYYPNFQTTAPIYRAPVNSDRIIQDVNLKGTLEGKKIWLVLNGYLATVKADHSNGLYTLRNVDFSNEIELNALVQTDYGKITLKRVRR